MKFTDDKRNEYILFSDLLGVSSLVDMVNAARSGTPSSVLGPFHIEGAPELANPAASIATRSSARTPGPPTAWMRAQCLAASVTGCAITPPGAICPVRNVRACL